MLVINKKRIFFILIMLVISVISFAINKNTENTVQTVSLPVSDKTIVLDAGHGYPDEGAESANGVHEDDIKAWSNYLNLNFLNCACSVTEGEVSSKRREVKELIKKLKEENENVDIHILRSSYNVNMESIIGYKDKDGEHSFLDFYDKNL